MAYLLFDIGGTKMRLALSEQGENFGEVMVVPTPKDFGEAMRVLGERARALAGGEAITLAAGGVAGTLDASRATLLHATHLESWLNQPLKNALSEAFGAPVVIENDAAVVGLGEALSGAGRGYGSVAYLTVSTGVGGAKIESGRIASSALGFEPGFQVIDYHTGETLESTISGTAFAKKYGCPPAEITDPAIWTAAAKVLAAGVFNAIVHWSPEVVVLGGSMMRAPKGIEVAAVAEALKQMPAVFATLPPVLPAALGDEGGIHGALGLTASR